MNLPFTEQKSAEWLEQRKKYVTASEFANCFNLTKEVTEPYIAEFELWDTFKPDPEKCAGKEGRQKYIEKKSGETEAFAGNQATRFGQRYENVAMRIYQQMKTMDVFEFGLIPHPSLPNVAASPDGCGVNGTLVEIKCPSTRTPTGVPPFEYWCQMQSQMECCDAECCDFFDASFVEFVDYTAWKSNALAWEKKHPGAKHHIYGLYYLSEKDSPVFAPVTINRVTDFENWFEKQRRAADLDENPRPVYYQLLEYYLTPVRRNRQWFNDRVADLNAVWREIQRRRCQQPALTAAKKLAKKDSPLKKRLTEDYIRSPVCLI